MILSRLLLELDPKAVAGALTSRKRAPSSLLCPSAYPPPYAELLLELDELELLEEEEEDEEMEEEDACPFKGTRGGGRFILQR